MSEIPEDQNMHLARMLKEALGDRGAPWLAKHAIDPATGTRMSVQGAGDLIADPRKGWVAPQRIRAIAALFEWPHSRVYIANATAIGLDPPPGVGPFASSLNPAAEQLPADDQLAIRNLVDQMCRARGLTT